MCMTPGCSGGGSGSKKSTGYTPKKQANKPSGSLPKGWAGTTGSGGNFGQPKVRATFGRRSN